MKTKSKICVLLIEDDSGDARLVAEVLKEAENGHFMLETVNTLTDGIKVVGTFIPCGFIGFVPPRQFRGFRHQ